MRSEELRPELAGIIARLEHRILADPAYAQVLGRDDPANSQAFILDGIERAIAGLVMLHIQVRRDLR
jgi:hypothetical protein